MGKRKNHNIDEGDWAAPGASWRRWLAYLMENPMEEERWRSNCFIADDAHSVNSASSVDSDIVFEQLLPSPQSSNHDIHNQPAEEKQDVELEAIDSLDRPAPSSLICPVCLDLNTTAMVLSCSNGHSICSQCTTRVFQARVPICPLCRGEMGSPPLPNLFLRNTVEEHRQQVQRRQQQVQCQQQQQEQQQQLLLQQ